MIKIFVRLASVLSLTVGLNRVVFAQSPLIDIEAYQFTLQLDESHDTIKGVTEITFKGRSSGSQYWLELAQAQDSVSGMVVTRVHDANGLKIFYQEADRIIIKDSIDLGEISHINIEYEGVPSKGLVISRNRYGDRTFFGDNWPNHAHYWLPCIDHPTDKALVSFKITAPEYYEVIATGELVEETNLGNGLKLTHWSSPHLLPTKSMVIGVARFASTFEKVDGVPISRWVFYQDRNSGFEKYDLTGPILDFFEDKVGPYPFAKLAHVQSKTRWGGSENSGTIFYFEKSVDTSRDNEGLFAHEIAHQWFGNSASEADWYHVWLSEGFATYFTHLYFEHRYGRTLMKRRLQMDRTRVIEYYHNHPSPIILEHVDNYDEVLTTNSYQKASWFLHMLREKIGDVHFWKAIREYYERFAYGNALTKDFRSVVEKQVGYSLKAFFQQWLYQSGHPKIDVSWNYYNGQCVFLIEQQQDGKFIFELPVEFHFADGRAVTKSIVLTESLQESIFRFDTPPTEVIIDPEVTLLFEQLK